MDDVQEYGSTEKRGVQNNFGLSNIKREFDDIEDPNDIRNMRMPPISMDQIDGMSPNMIDQTFGDELRNNIFELGGREPLNHEITNDVVNFANRLLNDQPDNTFAYPMINIDDVPFMNNLGDDDIDNFQMKQEE